MGRLTRRSEFVAAAKGAKQAARTCVVQARPREADAPVRGREARAGFTATKKLGGAVVRNRAKRRLREAARLLLPRLGRPGVDYVFVARQETATAAWASLLDDVERALIRLAASEKGVGSGEM